METRSEYHSQDQLNHVIAETILELIARNYKFRLRRETTCLYCFVLHQWIFPGEFTVDHSYRFEELSYPDADRVLYAISSTRGIKGYLMEPCNVYSDNISEELIQKLMDQ